MKRIALISDTHGVLLPSIERFIEKTDEIWHAGDIGDIALADRLREIRPLRAVFGNIDGAELRLEFPEKLLFQCNQVNVLMTHIGGYPGRYDRHILADLDQFKPDLFITGHSHILKIMPDKQRGLMHMNPGAAGNNGYHTFITAIRFVIDGKVIRDAEILEIKR
jgi:uncharacterized protein